MVNVIKLPSIRRKKEVFKFYQRLKPNQDIPNIVHAVVFRKKDNLLLRLRLVYEHREDAEYF